MALVLVSEAVIISFPIIAGDPYYGLLVGLVTVFTGGVEYVSDSGFLLTAEFGIGMSGGYFAPALGFSLGRKF